MTLESFINAAQPIITLGASANAAARQEIREVVGNLGDELGRALSLTDSYLVGAKFSIDDKELAKYLADVDGKLMGNYQEHHICAGLYHLADKFAQLFNPTKFSVSLSNYNEIPRLIDELKNGEQVLLDDLTDITNELRKYSSQLLSGSMSREDVLKVVEYHREKIDLYRKKIKRKRREMLAKL